MGERLFSEFKEVSAKEWKQKIQYELKGADYTKSLVWESPEGIKVKPFYHLDDLGSNYQTTNTRPASWKIAEEIFVANAKKANLKALTTIEKGAESLIFIIPYESVAIEHLLINIDLDKVQLHFQFQFLSLSFIKNLLTLLEKYNSTVFLNIDIIGHFARSGNWFFNEKQDKTISTEILELLHFNNNNTVLRVDAALYQNAGSNIVQQLAYALGHAHEFLTIYGPDFIKNIVFNISVGSNYFFEIAKIRALRKLWKALSSEYGLPPSCHIIATPSKRNKTLYGYNVNMIRTTLECMSAVLGGADTVCNLAYDSVYHKDNDFAERIARNQLLILNNESYFNISDDPAQGSYYIENLTEQLAEKGLQLFKDMEAKGGLLKQLKSQTIQRKIKESADKEQHLFNQGQEKLVGTNAYENYQDKMKGHIEVYPFIKQNERKTIIAPIIPKRLAEDLEKKRLKDESRTAK